MARPQLPRDFVARHKRRRMIEAISELTAEKGYEATKIADVVRRAGVARKTLYDNFDGKEELFLAALDESFAEMMAAVAAACRRSEEWEAGVEDAIGALLGYIAEKPAAARICLLEAISATPSSIKRYDDAMEAFVAILAEEAPGGGTLPATIEESLVGGVAWILQQQVRRNGAPQAAGLVPELSKFVLSPYQSVGKVDGTGRRK